MDYLHHELDLGADDAVEVLVDDQAYVRLLDDANFARYQRGERYDYQGGLASPPTIRIVAPRAGCWHLVIDFGGFTGSVRPAFRVLHAV